MPDLSADELAAELGLDETPKARPKRTPKETRIVAGFEDIQRFERDNGRAPQHGENRDIFERLYAVRLDRLRELEEARDLLADLDTTGLLDAAAPPADLDADDLAAELGIGSEVTELRNVRPRAEVRAAEEIANKTKCEDFDRFAPLFHQVQAELKAGERETRRFAREADIRQGEFFVVGGQMAYVAEVGDPFETKYDRRDARLRLIYDNGTESDILLRSLQRALYKDEAGRRITDPEAGPLFEDENTTGTIYVLRSLSDHPKIAAARTMIHKIGVTKGEVSKRVADAERDPTFLLAAVEVVASYKLHDIRPHALENLLHKFLNTARLEIIIPDRFGNEVRPREWFVVPLETVNELVERVVSGDLHRYRYDPRTLKLKAE